MQSLNGLIVVDKPAGITSTRVSDRVKRLLPRGNKIGHGGTLDQFATGVLVLLIGKGTKRCEALMDSRKQYEATIKFGAITPTDDPDSPEEQYRGTGLQPVLVEKETHGLRTRATEERLHALLPRFIGEIQQRPPRFSALKIGGRRASDHARSGSNIELAPRTVQVYNIELIDFAWPLLRLRIDCGRGTYIRSIARDLGELLEVGGYVSQLRRTRVGDYAADRAVTLDQLIADGVAPHLRSLTEFA